MRPEISDFRVPIVLTAVMITVLAYWTWLTWQRYDDHAPGKRHHEAFQISTPERDHGHTKKLIEHIILPFVVALLILGANAAAWMTVIRNRSLPLSKRTATAPKRPRCSALPGGA